MQTLGVATYLDIGGSAGRTDYRRDAQELNPVLLDSFGAMYARLCQVIENVTGIPAVLSDSDAIPGFHVFDPFTYTRDKIKAPHYDLHVLQRSDSSDREEPDSDRRLTMTAVLEAPACGAAIDFRGVDYEEQLRFHRGGLGRVNSITRGRLWRLRQRRAEVMTHEYTVGALLLIRGLPLHRIAPLPDGAEPGRRISLQGHAELIDGKWDLFS